MRTYVLRIYRYRKDKPHNLVGLVEEVGVEGRKAFTNYDELWEILNSPAFLLSSPQGTRMRRKKVDKGKTSVKKGGDTNL